MEVEGTEIGSFSVVEGCSARGGGDGGPAEQGRSRELIDNHQFPSNAPGEPPLMRPLEKRGAQKPGAVRAREGKTAGARRPLPGGPCGPHPAWAP